MLTICATVSEILSENGSNFLQLSEREKRYALMWLSSASVHSSIQPLHYFSPRVGKRKLWELWDTGEVETWVRFAYE